MVFIGNDWDNLLKEEFEKDYYIKLRNFLKIEYQTKKIYPDMYDIFNALKLTSYKDTKVVLLGQDPYHGENQAHGLAFSGKEDEVIFLLWGNNARSKKNLIDNNKHYILEAPHPSPLSASRGFFGCSHFSKTNEILSNLNKQIINWQISNI